MYNCVGLHPFISPELPADLGQGYPQQYTKKSEDAPVGVEPVVQAVIKVRLAFSDRLLAVVVLWVLCCVPSNRSAPTLCRPACKTSVMFAPFAIT